MCQKCKGGGENLSFSLCHSYLWPLCICELTLPRFLRVGTSKDLPILFNCAYLLVSGRIRAQLPRRGERAWEWLALVLEVILRSLGKDFGLG